MQTEVSPLPLHGNTAVEILVNDHKVIKNCLAQLEQASEKSERKTLLEQLKGALTVHNATEENLVYPALDKVAHKRSESEKLYHETAEADVLLFELDTMLKKGEMDEFPRTCEKLKDAVLEHIDDEESSAFPHLEKGADTEDSRLLTQAVREVRSMLRFTPQGRPATERGKV